MFSPSAELKKGEGQNCQDFQPYAISITTLFANPSHFLAIISSYLPIPLTPWHPRWKNLPRSTSRRLSKLPRSWWHQSQVRSTLCHPFYNLATGYSHFHSRALSRARVPPSRQRRRVCRVPEPADLRLGTQRAGSRHPAHNLAARGREAQTARAVGQRRGGQVDVLDDAVARLR